MNRWIRRTVFAIATVALAAGSSATIANAQAKPAQAAQSARERHPVLQRAIRQLETVKDELQKAPSDFNGHKEASIDAVTHAINELRAAEQADKH
jgi:acyl-CoA reductase-like NAD-dependent aldehyde dehydrogenase